MKVKRDELMVLLNNIFEEDPSFEIKAKLRIDHKDQPLVWVNLKERADVRVISEREYEELTFEYEDILPTPSDYVTSLVSAGILKPENWEEVCNRITKELKKSIYDRQRPLYVSLDTNCFIDRISYHLEQCLGSGAFVIADGVRKELFKEVAGRYTEYELRTFIRKDWRFKHFVNQPKVKERIRKIGRSEYDRFRRSVLFEEIPSGTGDNEIAEALSDFARARNCDVWLITFDKNMFEISAGFGIRPILFEFPRIHSSVKVKTSWENVRDLIYTMAVIFGFVNISGIHVFGVWSGKSPKDWNEERVLIEGRGELIERIERDLRILNEVQL